jgi:hypothetical protein
MLVVVLIYLHKVRLLKMYSTRNGWRYGCRQEGWRLEQKDVKDVFSPLMLKGVVYNEMKGVFVSCAKVG